MLELVMKGKKMMQPTTETISQSMADIIDVISDYDKLAIQSQNESLSPDQTTRMLCGHPTARCTLLAELPDRI